MFALEPGLADHAIEGTEFVNAIPLGLSAVLVNDFKGGLLVNLDARETEHWIELTRKLEDLNNRDSLPVRLGFLPESLGVVSGQACITFSESKPVPIAEDSRTLVPFTSLIENSRYFMRLALAGEEDFLEAMLYKLIEPLIESWCFLALKQGIVPRLSPQNLFLETSLSGEAQRIVIGGFKDFFIDKGFIIERDGECSFKENLVSSREQERREKAYSLSYDYALGCQVLDQLIFAACRNLPRYEELMRMKAKGFFWYYAGKRAFDVLPKRACFTYSDDTRRPVYR